MEILFELSINVMSLVCITDFFPVTTLPRCVLLRNSSIDAYMVYKWVYATGNPIEEMSFRRMTVFHQRMQCFK